MKSTLLVAAGFAAFVLLLGFATIPVLAYPLGLVLVAVYVALTAPDRRAARARKTGAR